MSSEQEQYWDFVDKVDTILKLFWSLEHDNNGQTMTDQVVCPVFEIKDKITVPSPLVSGVSFDNFEENNNKTDIELFHEKPQNYKTMLSNRRDQPKTPITPTKAKKGRNTSKKSRDIVLV